MLIIIVFEKTAEAPGGSAWQKVDRWGAHPG